MRGMERYSAQFARGTAAVSFLTGADLKAWVESRRLIGYTPSTNYMRSQIEIAIKEVDIAIFAAQSNSRSPDVPKD